MLLSQLLMLIYGHPYMFHFYSRSTNIQSYISLSVAAPAPSQEEKGSSTAGNVINIHAMTVFDVYLRNVAAR